MTIPAIDEKQPLTEPVAGRVRERFSQELVPLAYKGLERMLLPDGSGFCDRARRGADGKLDLIGRSQRYSAMSLIGVALQERLGRQSSFSTDKVYDCLVDWVDRDAYQGDAGLVLWALSLQEDPRAERVLARIVDREEQLTDKRTPRNSASLGWLLTGLSVAIIEGIGGDSARTTADSVCRLLLRNRNPATGLCSLAGAGRRKNIFNQRFNTRLGSFASQVYPTIGLSYYALATGNSEPLDLAEQSADALVRLQGREGQWWWIYDTRAGEPVMRYPVYSIHQDAMGPMALLAVSLATEGKKDYTNAVWKSLEWLNQHPECRDERLVDPEAGVVWRAIQRDKPTRTGAFGLGAAEIRRLHVSAWTGLVDRRPFATGYVCEECRPYHLGWILVAAAMFESCHKGEL